MAIIFIKKKIAASNKSQTHQEKPIQQAPGTVVPAPFIDKISIVVTIQKKDATAVHNAFWGVVDDTSVFNNTGYKAKGGFTVAKWLNLKSTEARVLLQFEDDKKNKQATRYRFEFNPRKVGESGLDELRAIVTPLMPDGWEYVIKHGRITRLDVAVDIPNTRPDNFAILPQQALTTKSWGVNGKLQTFVMGSKKGNQTLLYNKKAKRLKQGKPWPGKASVRMERRLLNPSPNKLHLLHELTNPFLAAQLIAMPDAATWEAKPYIWSLFKDSVAVRGLTAALALLTAEKRTVYRKHLNLFQHELWKPEEIWAKWPVCLAE